jgi:hypothetical protein
MKLKKFIATALTGALALSAALVPNIGSFAASGEWKNDGTGWWYSKADGSYAYSEWIDGYYLDANGYNTYSGVASWKKDSTGWYYQDTTGWYATGTCWIDGTKYNFDKNGYLEEPGWVNGVGGWWYRFGDGSYATSQWIDGYWISSNGYWEYKPTASWYKDDKGWYYMDTSGYYEQGNTVTIDFVDYTFDKDGYLVQYTELTPASEGSVKVSFKVSAATKATAAKQMSDLYGSITADGSKTTMAIDGVSKAITNKGGVVYVDDETLTAYVNRTHTTSTEVTFSFDAPSKTVLAGLTFGKSVASYEYSVQVGTVALTNITAGNGVVSFDAGGKHYEGDTKDGKIYLNGDVSADALVSALKSAGAIESNTPVLWSK